MTKPVSQLSVQELMELAKNPIKEDEFKKLPPAKRFVLSADIQPGKEKIPAALIYDRYEAWAKTHKIKPVSMAKFFTELKLYFDKIRYEKGFAYLMSPKGFNLSPEHQVLVNSKKRISANGEKKTKKKHKD